MNAIKWGRGGLLAVPMCACLVLSGCKDDGDDDFDLSDAGDGGVIRVDGGMDGSVPTDGGYADFVITTPSISATGHDRFFGVTYDEQGNIYAVGQSAPGVASSDDSALLVAKFKPNGDLDTSFGAPNGYVSFNANPGGQDVENARGILVYKANSPHAGKIVIAGQADKPGISMDAGVIARDTDVVLVRFLASGAVDTTFGTAGVQRHDLGTGFANPDGGASVIASDEVWSLGQTSDGKLVLHGASRGVGVNAGDGGPRTDSDWTLVRLTDNGALDPTFNTTGIVRTDIAEVNASARAATVLPDNSIVAAGYTTSSILTGTSATAQQPVIYKVTANGTPEATFAAGGPPDQLATPGVWHGFARSDNKNAEAYGAAAQSDGKFVTVGYGPTPDATGVSTDWVFFRFNADGSQDKTFGAGGQTFVDPAKLGDNGRAVVILPGDRVLGVGQGRRAQAALPDGGTPPDVDGMLAVLSPAGAPDTSFGPGGFRLLDWGNGDQLHAAAVAPSQKQVAIVGEAGGGREASSDDESVLVLWTLPGN